MDNFLTPHHLFVTAVIGFLSGCGVFTISGNNAFRTLAGALLLFLQAIGILLYLEDGNGFIVTLFFLTVPVQLMLTLTSMTVGAFYAIAIRKVLIDRTDD